MGRGQGASPTNGVGQPALHPAAAATPSRHCRLGVLHAFRHWVGQADAHQQAIDLLRELNQVGLQYQHCLPARIPATLPGLSAQQAAGRLLRRAC